MSSQTITLANQSLAPIKFSNSIWDDLDGFYSRIEKDLLNPVGYIPLVGSVSAIGRFLLANVQITVAGFGTVLESLMGAFSSDRAISAKHYDNMGACYEHSIHGTLNAVRSAVEFVPLLPLVTVLPMDTTGAFKFRYRSEFPCVKIIKETDFRVQNLQRPEMD